MFRAMWISGILLLVGASAAAQQGKGMSGMGKMGHGMQAMDDASFQPTIERLTAMLDLSTDQAEKIKPFRDTLLTETAALRTEATAARKALRAAREAGVDADSVTTLRAKVQASMQALMPSRMRFHERIKSVLTPDQVTRLGAHHAEQMQQMQEMEAGEQSGKMRGCCKKGSASDSQASHH